MTLAATDPSGNPLTYSLSCTSTCPSGLAVNSTTGVVSWTPTASQGGNYGGITFTASNGTITTSQTTSFKVYGPTLGAIPDQVAPPGNAFSYTLVGSSPISASLTYSVTSPPSGLSVNSSTGVVSWTPGSGVAGQVFNVTFSVSDGRVSASRVMKITVGIVCGGSVGDNCYSGTNAAAAKAQGEAYTPTGKVLTWTNNMIWVESGGTRLLKVDGTDAWATGLDMTGRTRTAAELNVTVANITGRACPSSVFVPSGDSGAGLAVSGRCLYYDGGNTSQRLDATAHDGVTNQTSSGSIRLGLWNTSAGGNSTSASLYEGNIQTCASKGMRLPAIYETAAGSNPWGGSTYLATDASPTFPSTSGGVPSVSGSFTWTSSAFTAGSNDYWVWSGADAVSGHYYDGSAVRCVVP